MSVINAVIFWLSDAIAIVLAGVGAVAAVVLVGYGLYRIGSFMLLGSARRRDDYPFYDDEDYP